MNSIPAATYSDPIRLANEPAEMDITSDDFRFVYYSKPERFFRGQRPFRLIHSKPALTTFTNVIYTPAIRGGAKQRLGCLYDDELNVIDHSLTLRRRADDLFNTDPPRFTDDLSDLPIYDRPVLYLNHIRPHFGHFLMETLSYWWALAEDLGDIDRFCFHVYNPTLLERPFIKACLNAMGITAENLVTFDRPTRLSRVIVPQTSFQLQSHIHTAYRDSMNKLAAALGVADARTTDQPLYLSRTAHKSGVRQYIGEEKVESFLAERGARIVHPQQLPFREQFKVINEHTHILGLQGSQLTNIIGALEPKKVTYFTEETPWGGSILINKCYDNQATFVKVCDAARVTRTYYSTVMRRLTGKKSEFDGFSKAHKVDHKRAITWLKNEGIV